MSDLVTPLFEKILVANRGEIACRIIKTARRLGILTVAVHSSADADALHVKLADEAYYIGEAPAPLSYLNGDAILETAQRCHARAIHPGYGFLSENTEFSRATSDRGMVFIGPPPDAIRLMGEKNAALERVGKAGVDTLPNNLGGGQSDRELQDSAAAIGYPLMVKPSTGGGGKGMHIVTSPDELETVLHTSRREAQSAFGNQALLMERYLEHARHIEVQVFADHHGNVVHLYERDCSVQRRHQKVIEESPATGLSESLRVKLQSQALLATRSVDYLGAGTVEFLVADDESYFLEMNTRLQVEHPVTELLTGIDLVEWQIIIAKGEPIPLAQADIKRAGHAIEVRVYAEDPDTGFLPASGKVTRLDLPPESASLRIDSGLQPDDEVSIHYDPLLMKLIARGDNREAALAEIRDAVQDTHVDGVKTNLAYLSRVLRQPDFVAGTFDTGLLDEQSKTLAVSSEPASEQMLVLACLYVLLHREQVARRHHALDQSDGYSPWRRLVSWRLNHRATERITIRNNRVDKRFSVRRTPRGCELDNGVLLAGRLTHTGQLSAQIGKKSVTVTITQSVDGFVVDDGTELQSFIEVGIDDYHTDSTDHHGHLRSPMPGTIVSTNVWVGDKVSRGQTLLVLEAMKMEHTITAPADGIVTEMIFQAGDRVDADVELLVIEPATDGS